MDCDHASGAPREIDCPRCKGGKSGYEFLRPKRYERILEINEYVISEISIRRMKSHNSDDVRTHISYTTSPYSGSTSPDKIFTDRDSAAVAGDAMMVADATRTETEWDKDQKRAEAMAGVDILAAFQMQANKATDDLKDKIERLRQAMMDAIKYPYGDGPKLSKPTYGSAEITSQAMAEWCNGLLDHAGIDGWSEGELHEALCDC